MSSQSHEKLKKYISENHIEAYRILHSGFGSPFAVDIYKDNAVVHVFHETNSDSIKQLEDNLRSEIGISSFFYKDRTKKKIKLPISTHKEIDVTEYGHKFHINLSDYLDTGLFLDHRETRKWIGEISKGKKVLNTFAYTGSFTIYAAKSGALLTHSVDLSRTYCEWIKQNLTLNELPLEKNWTFKMDTREYFKYAHRKKLSFDIIIIDPPTFSRNKGETFSLQRDYVALINEAHEILNPNGFILFSNNFTEFHMEKYKLPGLKIENKLDLIPPDFEGVFSHNCYVIK